MAKKGASGGGTIRQRADGRWEGRVCVGRDPATGKMVRRSVYGATQKEVRQKLSKIVTDIDNGTYTAPSRLTVNQWLDIWERDYLDGVKRSSRGLYNQQLRLYIRPALGEVKLEALTAPAIQHTYNELSAERGGPLAPKTLKNLHGIFHKALQQAVSVGYLRFNPADACTLPRMTQQKIKPMTDEQTTAFLDAIRGHRHETLFKVALFTGMREGELLGLQWDAIDFERGTITIKQQLRRDGGEYYISTTKNDKVRTITPAPSVMNMLRGHRREQSLQRLKLGPVWDNHDLVFPNDTGGFLSRQTVYCSFKRVAARIGLPDARFHDLRHTYAVNALRAGDSVKDIQDNLGHYSAGFTADIYLHTTEKMQQDSSQRMERFMEDVLGSA